MNNKVDVIVKSIRTKIEDIKSRPALDIKVQSIVLEIKALIKQLEDIKTTDSYYNLLVLITQLQTVNISMGDKYIACKYADEYMNLLDDNILNGLNDIKGKQAEELSLVFMVLGHSVKIGYKDYNGASVCKFYTTSFIMSPSKEMLIESVKEYLQEPKDVSYKEIKLIIDLAIKYGFYEAYVYNILTSAKEESANVEDAVALFIEAINDKDEKDKILMAVNQLMYSNLKVLEKEAQETGKFNPSVIPMYCLMFIAGNDLVALDLDNILIKRPEYVETLKGIMTKEYLIKYVDVVKSLRAQRKEPN